MTRNVGCKKMLLAVVVLLDRQLLLGYLRFGPSPFMFALGKRELRRREREREREKKRERVHLPKLTSIKDISFPLSYIAFAARERERMRVPGRDRENEKRE